MILSACLKIPSHNINNVMVAGFGNVLLDCLIKITDKKLLVKHNLKEDDAKEIPQNELTDLMKDLKHNSFKCYKFPGGCTMNTLRILQWIIGNEFSTVMFGSVGDDANGELLKDMVLDAKVCPRFTIAKSKPTGFMVSLVHGQNRSLVGNIGAAGFYNPKYLLKASNTTILKATDLIYLEGFFLTKGRDSADSLLLKFCKNHNKKLVFNLCAPYVIENSTAQLINFVNASHIVIGNRREFEILAKKMHKDGVKQLISDLTKPFTGKIVVVTDGPEKTLCAYYPNKLEVVHTKKMNASEIVDSTGAGDSFLAGFLGCYLRNGSPPLCIKWGTWVAQQVIRKLGCDIEGSDKAALFNIK